MSNKNFKERFQKRILLEISALTLELEESEELDTEFSKKFTEDFQKELQYKASLLEDSPEAVESTEEKSQEHHTFLKEVYRRIAKRTHPDRCGEEFEEEFKSAAAAYQENDWLTLLMIAADLKINLPLFDEEAYEQISKEIEKKKSILQKKKESLVWVWATSKDSPESRRQARFHMDIDEDKFQEFLKENSN